MLRYASVLALLTTLLYPNETDHIYIAGIRIDTLHVVKKHIKKPRTIEQILRNPLGG